MQIKSLLYTNEVEIIANRKTEIIFYGKQTANNRYQNRKLIFARQLFIVLCYTYEKVNEYIRFFCFQWNFESHWFDATRRQDSSNCHSCQLEGKNNDHLWIFD